MWPFKKKNPVLIALASMPSVEEVVSRERSFTQRFELLAQLEPVKFVIDAHSGSAGLVALGRDANGVAWQLGVTPRPYCIKIKGLK